MTVFQHCCTRCTLQSLFAEQSSGRIFLPQKHFVAVFVEYVQPPDPQVRRLYSGKEYNTHFAQLLEFSLIRVVAAAQSRLLRREEIGEACEVDSQWEEVLEMLRETSSDKFARCHSVVEAHVKARPRKAKTVRVRR